MFLFNLPYKLFTTNQYGLFDTFVNSLTETYMLFLNLVLSHGMYASNQTKPFVFYAPKIITSLAIFIGLWAWSYADLQEYRQYIAKDFVVDENAKNFEQNCFKFFFIVMLIYATYAAYLSFRALSANNSSNYGLSRFRNQAGGLVLIVSGCTVSLVVFPFESQTLQFMNENGVVNIYMIVLSYMFSPNTRMDDEIIIDEDGNVSE